MKITTNALSSIRSRWFSRAAAAKRTYTEPAPETTAQPGWFAAVARRKRIEAKERAWAASRRREDAERQAAEDRRRAAAAWKQLPAIVAQRVADGIDAEREKRFGHPHVMSVVGSVRAMLAREPRWARRLRELKREHRDDPGKAEETLYRELLDECRRQEKAEAEGAARRIAARQESEASPPAPDGPAPDDLATSRFEANQKLALQYLRTTPGFGPQ